MEISKATRTHLFYQSIIMILLFFGNGYEILLDRKIMLILASVPIVCYQLIVLACCMELIPIPSCMSFLQLTNKDCNTEEAFEKDFEHCSSPAEKGKILNSHQSKEIVFSEVGEILPSMRRWEKSVINLGATPKCYVCPQKSKSWMNLSDSRSSDRLSSSREGSVDTVDSYTDEKAFPQFQIRSEKTNREERAAKAKSWKTSISDFKNCLKPELVKSYSLKERVESPSCRKKDEQEESELEKSYSFPFRQKRLQSWLEMKESTVEPPPDVPYWQSVGYNLAVKYEARRRQRDLLKSTKNAVSNEDFNLVKSTENVPGEVSNYKPNAKKLSKFSSARMTKFKTGFSNLMLKKKDEIEESPSNSNKVGKSVFFKLKNRTPSRIKEREPTEFPEFPQFLNNDRPLIFYPKYLPFEKERFEGDVQKKIVELTEEQKSSNHQYLSQTFQ